MIIVRITVGIVIGVVIGFLLVMGGDMLNHMLWPPPPEVQVTNPESIREYMATAPITSLLGLPLTWTVAAFAAAFAAARIGTHKWVGWIAGALIFAATGLNLALIPHPLWMLLSAIVFVPLAVWAGAKVGAPARR